MSDEIETLYRGKFLALRRDGRWEYAERVRGVGGAAIVALTAAGEIVLVEQFRHPVGGRTIELPAGIVGDDVAGEAPETTALRELDEETGFRASSAELLMSGPTAPGLTSEPTHMVLALGLERIGPGGGVDGEDIVTHGVSRSEAPDWLAARAAEGRAVEPKVYAGLFFAGRVAAGAASASDR